MLMSNEINTEGLSNSYLVVPVVAIREGVLNDLFYPRSEILKSLDTWNGRPVPVNHPEDERGFAISANRPDVEDRYNIGFFYNVKYERGDLKGEIWINVQKAINLGFEGVIQRLQNGEQMEVSTGLLADLRQEDDNNFNGRPYFAIVLGMTGDHLALLPNDLGACSVADGCGTHRNEKVKINCAGSDGICEDCESCGVAASDLNKKASINDHDRSVYEQFFFAVKSFFNSEKSKRKSLDNCEKLLYIPNQDNSVNSDYVSSTIPNTLSNMSNQKNLENSEHLDAVSVSENEVVINKEELKELLACKEREKQREEKDRLEKEAREDRLRNEVAKAYNIELEKIKSLEGDSLEAFYDALKSNSKEENAFSAGSVSAVNEESEPKTIAAKGVSSSEMFKKG